MPRRSPSLTVAIYAMDARRLAGFYAEVLRLSWAEEGVSFVLLASAGIELAIVQAPPNIAEAIVVADPPVVREDTCTWTGGTPRGTCSSSGRWWLACAFGSATLPLLVPLMESKEVRPMSTLPTIIPISDLRQDTAGVIKRVAASDRPVVITQRGRATAVLVSAEAYERTQHENEILRVLARGDAEIAAGLGRDAEDVMAEARALLSAE